MGNAIFPPVANSPIQSYKDSPAPRNGLRKKYGWGCPSSTPADCQWPLARFQVGILVPVNPRRAAMRGDVEGELQPAPYPQFVEDAAQLVLNHLLRATEQAGNVGIGFALPDQGCDLDFLGT